MTVDLNETDKAILKCLKEGRATPAYLTEQIDKTRQAIQNRLTVLRAGGHIKKVHTGLYEITPQGKSKLTESATNDSQ